MPNATSSLQIAQAIARKHNVSSREVIQRALVLYQAVEKEWDEGKPVLTFVNREGELVQAALPPLSSSNERPSFWSRVRGWVQPVPKPTLRREPTKGSTRFCTVVPVTLVLKIAARDEMAALRNLRRFQQLFRGKPLNRDPKGELRAVLPYRQQIEAVEIITSPRSREATLADVVRDWDEIEDIKHLGEVWHRGYTQGAVQVHFEAPNVRTARRIADEIARSRALDGKLVLNEDGIRAYLRYLSLRTAEILVPDNARPALHVLGEDEPEAPLLARQ